MASPDVEFDHIFVVSDLHIADSETLIPMFPEEHDKLLAETIKHAGQATGRVAFVLNGDIIDFLADGTLEEYNAANRDAPRYGFGDAADAVGVVDRAMKKRARRTLRALKAFVATSNGSDRVVFVCGGNHDLEACHALVRDWWRTELAPKHVDAVRFDPIGAEDGLALRVPKSSGSAARVRIVHGHAVDGWNKIPHPIEALRALTPKNGVSTVPCTGTMLVVEKFNPLKGKYPWIDLLKPETELVAPILQYLDPRPGFWLGVRGLRNVPWRDLTWTQTIHTLGDDLAAGSADGSDRLRRRSQDDWFAYAEASHDAPADNSGVLGDAVSAAQQATWLRRPKSLAEALQRCAAAEAAGRDAWNESRLSKFDLDILDGVADADIVVAGHTHFARWRPAGGGKPAYLNPGSWIHLLRVTHAELGESAERFAGLLQSAEALKDALKNGNDIAILRPWYAHIYSDKGTVHAVLRDASDHHKEVPVTVAVTS